MNKFVKKVDFNIFVKNTMQNINKEYYAKSLNYFISFTENPH
jgi:hypothetical protein